MTERPTRDYSQSLMVVCERVNGSVRGSGDGLGLKECVEAAAFLRGRLDAWQSGHESVAEYDEAVRVLVEAAWKMAQKEIECMKKLDVDRGQ